MAIKRLLTCKRLSGLPVLSLITVLKSISPLFIQKILPISDIFTFDLMYLSTTVLHTHIHTHMRTCIHTYIHIHTHIHIHTYIHTYIPVHTYKYIPTHVTILLIMLRSEMHLIRLDEVIFYANVSLVNVHIDP